MGMSTRVTGFVSSNNEEYIKHSKVLRACIDAKIGKLPKETADFFGSEYPEEYLFDEKLEIKIKTHVYNEDMTEGFEVILSELPKEVYKIRFSNSY
jgi:hypothetical protein